jgi:CTP synthase (UTP-ammonia lyase)
MNPDVLILGEYNPESETHRATDAAIGHSLAKLDTDLSVSWASTAEFADADILESHGLWIAPGSPYRDFVRAFNAIRLARENGVPCLGTCGGFQHMILEFARNVLGFTDACHAEYDPHASRPFISPLSCAVAGRELRVTLQLQTTARTLDAKDEVVERYYCHFGVNPEYADTLIQSSELIVSGRDLNGEIRIIEVRGHPFFVGTLFVPQLQSREEAPHPIVNGFLRAVQQRKAEHRSPVLK